MSPVKRLAVNYANFCKYVRQWDDGNRDLTVAREVWASASGLRHTQDELGEYLHDDDLLAYYEQSAWQAIEQDSRIAA